jgi:hypothetical protein
MYPYVTEGWRKILVDRLAWTIIWASNFLIYAYTLIIWFYVNLFFSYFLILSSWLLYSILDANGKLRKYIYLNCMYVKVIFWKNDLCVWKMLDRLKLTWRRQKPKTKAQNHNARLIPSQNFPTFPNTSFCAQTKKKKKNPYIVGLTSPVRIPSTKNQN